MELHTQLLLVGLLLATGVVTGLLAGLLGIGGGLVVVPALYYLFNSVQINQDLLMLTAVGSSLATIVATGFMSAMTHYRHGNMDVQLLKGWAPTILLGVIAGSWLGDHFGGSLLTAVFASVAILVAGKMVFWPDKLVIAQSMPTGVGRGMLGTGIGVLSSMMGIGGGVLGTPIMTLCGYPIRKAVATSSGIGLLIAVPGCISAIVFGMNAENLPPFSIGYVNLLVVACIIPTSMFFAPKGARLAHRISPKKLKIIFATFMVFTGVRMWLDILAIS